MIDKEKFLTSYNIEPEELKAAGLDWEEPSMMTICLLRENCAALVRILCTIISMILRGQASIPTGTALRIPAI